MQLWNELSWPIRRGGRAIRRCAPFFQSQSSTSGFHFGAITVLPSGEKYREAQSSFPTGIFLISLPKSISQKMSVLLCNFTSTLPSADSEPWRAEAAAPWRRTSRNDRPVARSQERTTPPGGEDGLAVRREHKVGQPRVPQPQRRQANK